MDWTRLDAAGHEETAARLRVYEEYRQMPPAELRAAIDTSEGEQRFILIIAAIMNPDYPSALLPPDSRGLRA
jgi:hypothetical protein